MAAMTTTEEATYHTFLETENAHPRDAELRFEPTRHAYTIEGSKALAPPVSVTTLTSRGVWPDFEADKTIDKILASDKYKSGESPYAGMSRSAIRAQWDANGLKARVEGTKLHDRIEKYYNTRQAHAERRRQRQRQQQQQQQQVPRRTEEANDDGRPPKKRRRFRVHEDDEHEEPKAEKAEPGAAGGLGLDEDEKAEPEAEEDDVAWRQFLAWATSPERAHLVPYRTEWRIFSRRCNVAGSVDMVFHNTKTGALDIYDWKRAKEIKRDGWGRYATHPLLKVDEIPDAAFYKYSMQLSAYKYILETEYAETLPYPIGELWLVRMDEDGDRTEADPVEAVDMIAPVKKLMENRWV